MDKQQREKKENQEKLLFLAENKTPKSNKNYKIMISVSCLW